MFGRNRLVIKTILFMFSLFVMIIVYWVGALVIWAAIGTVALIFLIISLLITLLCLLIPTNTDKVQITHRKGKK